MSRPVTITHYHVGGEQRALVKGNAPVAEYWVPAITNGATIHGEVFWIWPREPYHVPEDIQ